MTTARFNHFICCLIALSLPVWTTAHAQQLHPHEKMPGSGVKAHWVHLSGHYGDKEKSRAILVQAISDCIADARRSGVPHQEVQPDQIPSLVHSIEIDLYITPNRVMHFKRASLYSYRPGDCSLIEMHKHRATLGSSNGICEIDLNKKTAAGMCDAARHASAAALPVKTPAQLSGSPLLPQKTGAKKFIAGLECDVYKAVAPFDGFYCISSAGSFIAPALLGIVGLVSGIGLEVESPLGNNLKATQASIDATINSQIFAVPSGIKVKPLAGAGQ